MLILALAAAHQGEEFVIILPAIMLVGAFFMLRWANQNDKQNRDEEGATAEAVPEQERPVGLVLPKLTTTDSEVEARQETSV